MTNVNNGIELRVVLGLNDTASKTSLNTQIAELEKKLNEVKIDIKIDPKAVAALEKLSTIDFSKITSSLSDVTKETKKMAIVTADEVEKAMKKAFDIVGLEFKSVIKGTTDDLDKFKRELAGTNANIKVDFDIENGAKKLNTLKAQIEKDGITQTVTFEKVIRQTTGSETDFVWMPKAIQEVDKQISSGLKNTDELITKMTKLRTEGKITQQQFEELSVSISGIGGKDGLNIANQKMDEMVATTKKVNANLVDREQIEKRLVANQQKIQTQILSAEKAMKSNPTLGGSKEANDLVASYQKLNPASKNFKENLFDINTQFTKMKTGASEASRDSMGMIDSFKEAMIKFPIWMAASTLFYGTIRTATEFASIIVDIDTKMTNLAKVMSEDTDFEAVFERATLSSEKFGQSISSSLDAFTEFSRQGFKGEDLGLLADAGLAASNVGEMTAQKASEYMTASLIQWNMDAKESMGIIDSWNEISNNYATTTEKLAAGQAKAGSVARVMGLEFDQVNAIIGSVTASTKQSGNEIGNFLKNVLPRLTSDVAGAELDNLGVSLTDKDGNLRDIIQVYSEVAEKIKGVSDIERVAAIEGLAGKFHISRMSALLTDLGSADSMYRNMYESSKNSAGSAMEENERFMESLQARINLARVEVEKLALAFGSAFITEGMVSGLRTFGEFLGLITKFVSTFGALPALLGTTGVALFLLSSNFRKLTGSVGTTTASLLGFNGAAKATATSSALGASAVRGFSVAFKGLLASSGVGLVLVGVGIAIESLLGSMEKQRKMQEDIAQENLELSDSYTNNKEAVLSLTDEYSKLEEAMKTGKPDTATQERYFEVQNELASLMPSLVEGEDSYGNKLLGNASIIESRIKLIERQVEAELALVEAENAKADAEKLAESKKSAKSNKAIADIKVNEFGDKARSFLTGFAYKEEIKNIEDMQKALEHFESVKQNLLAGGSNANSPKVIEVQDTIDDLTNLTNQYQMYQNQAEASERYVASKATETAEKRINENENISKSSKELAKGILYDATLMAKSVKESESVASIFEGIDSKEFQDVFKDASAAVNSFTKSSSEDFASQTKNMESFSKKLKETLLINAKDSKGNALLSGSDEYKNIEASVDSYIQKLILQETQVRNVATAQGITIEQARLLNYENGELEDGTEELNDEMEKYIASLKELTSVEEQLAGVSQKQISEVDDLLYLYKSLSSQTDLTAEQTLMLEEAQAKLLAIYPDLSKFGSLRIEDIENEKMAQEVLLEAIELSKDGKLTAEEEMTLSSAINTKAKIEHKKQEILALAGLALAYQQFAKAQADEAARLQAQMEAANGAIDNESAMQDAEIRGRKFAAFSEAIAQGNDEYAALSEALEQLERDMNGYTNSLGSANERVKESEEAQKGSNKETGKSIYYTDKFASALERINLAIEKQNSLQSKYPTYSKTYQDSLRKESVLLQQKLKLTEDQIDAQKKQINSGKIAPKGMVNTSATSNSGKGAYTGKYSTEINKAASTYNIDPYLIAAVIQAESNFNPNAKSGAGARGLMQLMPGTAKELGVSDSYNPSQNIMGGVKYLAQQLKTFNGDLKLALAAYNAGAGNVKKYGGIPPFKETQNYVAKITAEYGTGLANATTTVTKALSGWSGARTGNMGDSRANGTRKHNGIDIAQPLGTRLDANVGGKVIASGDAKSQGYDKSYGNLVVVQDSTGAKHFYAHLEKAIAKLGSTITAGTQLGTVGSTGASSGSHLHYGVQKNGKFVDPESYVQNAKNTVTTSSSSSNDAASETAQTIDQAKSDLISLEADALAIQEAIEQLEVELINSQLSGFDQRIDNYQKIIDAETAKLGELDLASKRYQASLQRQYEFMGYQKQVQEEELAYVNKLIRSGSLSNKVKDEMTEKAKELTTSIQSLGTELKNITFEKIMVTMRMFNEALDDTQYALDKSNAILGKLEEGSVEYTNEMKKQVPLLETQRQQLIDQRDSLLKSLKIHKLTAEQVKDIKEQIEDLNLSIWNTEGAIVDANKAMEDMHKNKIIETMTKQQEEHIEALRKKYDDLNESLENLFSEKEVFDFGMFKDGFDEILYDLNKLDDVLASNPLFSESTNLSRNNLSQLRSEIAKVSDEITKMTKATSKSDVELERMIRSQIEYANALFEEIQAVENTIRDRQLEQRKTEDALQNQIDLKKEQIQLLDEEYEKEDRLKQIQDVNDEMDKVRSDKRFSYIDSSGKEILTFDKSRMNELQLQKDEMLKQFNREDVKAAMNAEVIRLEEKLNKTREIHAAEIRILQLQKDALSNLYDAIVANTNEKMEELETIQNEHVEAVTKSWEDTIEAVTNGTISFDTLMTEFYGKAMKDLSNYVSSVVSQIEVIKNAYASLATLSATAPPTPTPNLGLDPKTVTEQSSKDNTAKLKTDSAYVESEKARTKKVIENRKAAGLDTSTQESYLKNLDKYHDGGIVGKTGGSRLAELTNKLFNTKPNEQIVKSLVGELQVPPHNIPNLFTNINSMLSSIMPKQQSVQPIGDTIILQGVVIQANNPKQFFNDLDMHIRMNKS